MIKVTLQNEWAKEQPGGEIKVAHHHLSREEQLAISQIRTGRNRLSYHLLQQAQDRPDQHGGHGGLMAEHIL